MAAAQHSDTIIQTVVASSGVSARELADARGLRIETVLTALILACGKRVQVQETEGTPNPIDVKWEGL